MNSPKRFRAWLPNDQEMHTVDSIHFDNNDQVTLVKFGEAILWDEESGGYGWEREGNDVVLMHWTGLNDKNGKEIYEKDLLWNGRFYGDTGGKVLHTVEWRDGYHFAFTNMGGSQDDGAMLMGKSTHEWCKCTIVGNVYENPELLPSK
jgi:uncharacterized phage protein (TIGR01671 family)